MAVAGSSPNPVQRGDCAGPVRPVSVRLAGKGTAEGHAVAAARRRRRRPPPRPSAATITMRARRQPVPRGMVFDHDATRSPVPVFTGLQRKPAAAQGDVEARHTRAAPGDADHRGVDDGLLPGTTIGESRDSDVPWLILSLAIFGVVVGIQLPAIMKSKYPTCARSRRSR